MDIKATDVKKLREKTGAGMLDCKKALVEAEGDFDQAEKLLKEKGLAAAAKRSERATNEGRIFTKVDGTKAAIIELSCETDFVARNADFISLGHEIAADVTASELSADAPELVEKVKDAVGRIKENMSLRRAETIRADENEFFTDYIHGDTGRIGVVVRIKTEKPELKDNETVKQFAHDIALHVAAFRPRFRSESDVSETYLKEQEEIFTTQAQQLDKPENVVAGIVKGKMKKHLSEICLMDQGFVKDEKRSVAAVAKDISNEVGGNVEVSGFLYYSVGQEI